MLKYRQPPAGEPHNIDATNLLHRLSELTYNLQEYSY